MMAVLPVSLMVLVAMVVMVAYFLNLCGFRKRSKDGKPEVVKKELGEKTTPSKQTDENMPKQNVVRGYMTSKQQPVDWYEYYKSGYIQDVSEAYPWGQMWSYPVPMAAGDPRMLKNTRIPEIPATVDYNEEISAHSILTECTTESTDNHVHTDIVSTTQ